MQNNFLVFAVSLLTSYFQVKHMLTDYGDNMHCQFFEILRSLLDSSPGAQVCFLSCCLLHTSLTSHRFSSATVLTIRNLLFYSVIVE